MRIVKISTIVLIIASVLSLVGCNGKTYHGNVIGEYEINPIKEVRISYDSVGDEYGNAEIDVCYNDGKQNITMAHDENALIKLRGNSANMVTEKWTYTIKFSGKENILGSGAARKYALVSNYHDKSLMRNALAYDFGILLDLCYSPVYEFVDVWVNDVYYGNYILCETLDVKKTRVDIDTENGDFLIEVEEKRSSKGTKYVKTDRYGVRFAINEMDDVTSEQSGLLLRMLGDVEDAIASYDYSEIQKYIDVESMIDFFIVEELFKNMDFSFSSTRYYFKDGILFGGPIWDFDLSSGNVSNADDKNKKYNNYGEFGNQSGNSYECLWTTEFPWCEELMKCPEFRHALIDRYFELQPKIQNLYSENELGESRIDALLDEYGHSFEKNYDPKDEGGAGWKIRAKYIGRYADETFEENVEYLRRWLKNRNEWLLDYYQSIYD